MCILHVPVYVYICMSVNDFVCIHVYVYVCIRSIKCFKFYCEKKKGVWKRRTRFYLSDSQ